jgi:hypothetical protein
MRADSTLDGLLKVSLRGVNASNQPTAVTWDSTQVQEVSFNDSYQWIEFAFSNLTNLNPATKYAILVQGVSGTTSSSTYLGTIQYVTSTLNVPPIPGSTWLVVTTTSGGTWSVTSGSSLRYKIYGTTTP